MVEESGQRVEEKEVVADRKAEKLREVVFGPESPLKPHAREAKTESTLERLSGGDPAKEANLSNQITAALAEKGELPDSIRVLVELLGGNPVENTVSLMQEVVENYLLARLSEENLLPSPPREMNLDTSFLKKE